MGKDGGVSVEGSDHLPLLVVNRNKYLAVKMCDTSLPTVKNRDLKNDRVF